MSNKDLFENSAFKKIILSPVELGFPSLAIAASRSGSLGVLDAEFSDDIFSVNAQLEILSEQSINAFGLKVSRFDATWLDLVLRFVDKGMSYLIVDDCFSGNEELLSCLVDHGVKLFVEVRSLHASVDILGIDCAGVIVKGNEAGGFTGEDSSFILLQKWLSATNSGDRAGSSVPLFVRGGITPHTAAACSALGVAGGVVDSQVLLLRESPLANLLKPVIGNLTGTETVAAGDAEKGRYFRILSRPGFKKAEAFVKTAEQMSSDSFEQEIRGAIEYENPANGLMPAGQDICFAADWQRQFGTVSRMLEAIDEAVNSYLDVTLKIRPLMPASPLANDLKTELPLVQGPMTRVSDNADFAEAVARDGALPMLALALLKGKALEQLLHKTSCNLDGRPWGIGLLGFAPQDLLDLQVATALPYKPDYAIIAGGRPDQAVKLEASGIPSFLHVPSERLIPLFLKEGARRFIFEGRECGGHVGPLGSFVLWSSMVDRLVKELEGKPFASDVQILFAGGISDAVSSALVQVMAAPLLKLGVKIGFVMGTAYLLTREITESGAIVKDFQQQVLACEQTVNLESGPGHASRCAYTPFAQSFFEKRRDLKEKNVPGDEAREALDDLILGRLRIASKGTMRNQDGKLVKLDQSVRQQNGMYMLGQVATLHNSINDIASLHKSVTIDATQLLFTHREERDDIDIPVLSQPVDIAIVGISSLLPGAPDTQSYWENILAKKDAITEIPKHRWDWRLYFDENREAKDKIYSRWGGFLDDMAFDPTRYGMPPKSMETIDPMQLMVLEIASRTLTDSGYSDRPFNREKASVIIGASGGAGDVGMQYGLRSELTRFNGELPDEIADRLPQWSEDTFAGILMNVIAGRIANRLDFGGVNFATDAACASSLAAVYQGIAELTAGRSDFVIAGGADAVQGPFGYLCFSKTQALSPRGRCRTFDAGGDGIVISEGIAMVALKRLSDAERDGDHIYAVIKGMGGSSDGRAKGLTAPLPEGQLRAMRRAYEQAGFGADTVGLFEAHGTGTVAGDTAELNSTGSLMRESGALARQAVVGSVKTNIGHTKATAGVAGMIKAALALQHKTLPPHRNVEVPNEVLLEKDNPLFLIDEAQPWLEFEHPRRAAVSAFGFGGTNFHAVMEEYKGNYLPWDQQATTNAWPVELFVFSADSSEQLLVKVNAVLEVLENNCSIALANIACSLASQWSAEANDKAVCIAVSHESLREKLLALKESIQGKESKLPVGIYTGKANKESQKLAVLFSGQGSQNINMLRELAVHFSEVRVALEQADNLLKEKFDRRFGKGRRLSHFIFPRGAYSGEDKTLAGKQLTRTDIAQPALGACETGLWQLMQSLGLQTDMFAGHSYGEFVALHAAGVLDYDALMQLSEARGRFIVDEAKTSGAELGTMAAVQAERERVEKIIKPIGSVIVANHNGPQQSIISGSSKAISQAVDRLNQEGIGAKSIPVAAAFHSEYVAPARQKLAEVIEAGHWQEPVLPVYSNTTADAHSKNVNKLKTTMAEHLVKPVEFVRQIENMYSDGARVFLEVGPKSVLKGLVERILGGREYNAIALDDMGGGIHGFLNAIGQLLCLGVDLDLQRLFEGRGCKIAPLNQLQTLSVEKDIPAHAWMINGSGVRRAGEAVKQIGVTLEDAQQDKKESVGNTAVTQTVTDTKNKLESFVSNRRVVNKRSYSSNQKSSRQSLARRLKPREEKPMSENSWQDHAEMPEVVSEYFDTMRQFLETQERVVNAFLESSGNTSTQPARSRRRLQKVQMQVAPAGLVEPLQQEPVAEPLVEEFASAAEEQLSPSVSVELPAVAEDEAGEMDRQVITDKLLAIIEDRTGYPRDMVGLDQNLEADLGIDSIKRVEVVGALLQELPESYSDALGEERGELNTRSTLNEMLDLLEGLNFGAAKETVKEAVASVPFDIAGMGSKVVAESTSHPFRKSGNNNRHIVWPVAEPVPENVANALNHGPFIVTGGNQDMLKQLEGRLGNDRPLCWVDSMVLQDEQLLSDWCKEFVAQHDQVAGVVHLAPLQAAWLGENSGLEECEQQIQRNEKSLFLLMQNIAPVLAKEAHVVALSNLGGLFGRRSIPCAKEPIGHAGISFQGGSVGFLKSLHEERPALRVRAIDMDPALPLDALVDILIKEMQIKGGRLEVGYPAGERTVFRTIEQVLESEQTLDLKGSVVLATGGGRGITAEVLRKIAAECDVLILTGRSRLLVETETAELKTEQELRKYFINQIRAGKTNISLANVQNAVDKILAGREVHNNIADFEKSGAKVFYCAVDVTDDAAMRCLLNSIYEEHGRLDGVIHGAGIIEDKLFVDKQSESWSRVVNTKVCGLFLLQKYLKAESLKFLSVFSSVAGRYGNSGQTDYATANELLNRICCQLQDRWETKVNVSAINWGPWAATKYGAGMVGAETQRKFAEKGVTLVSASGGAELFYREICSSGQPVEIIAGASDWEAHEQKQGAFERLTTEKNTGSLQCPLLTELRVDKNAKGEQFVTFSITQQHRYLNDHQIDNIPVLPAAAAMEMMSEAVAGLWPGWQVVEVRDLRLLKGIQMQESSKELTIVINPPPYGSVEGFEVNVLVRSGTEANFQFHYKAAVRLEQQPPPCIERTPVKHGGSSIAITKAYEEWLFHGPMFQMMTEVSALSKTGANAQLNASSPSVWLPKNANKAAQWIFDPAVVDSALQLTLLWVRQNRNMTALPGRIGRVTRYVDVLPENMHMELQALPTDDDSVVHTHVWLTDDQGNLVLSIEDIECIADAKLNRLGGTAHAEAVCES